MYMKNKNEIFYVLDGLWFTTKMFVVYARLLQTKLQCFNNVLSFYIYRSPQYSSLLQIVSKLIQMHLESIYEHLAHLPTDVVILVEIVSLSFCHALTTYA